MATVTKTFKFNIGDSVKTPNGAVGIVDGITVDAAGNIHYTLKVSVPVQQTFTETQLIASV